MFRNLFGSLKLVMKDASKLGCRYFTSKPWDGDSGFNI